MELTVLDCKTVAFTQNIADLAKPGAVFKAQLSIIRLKSKMKQVSHLINLPN